MRLQTSELFGDLYLPDWVEELRPHQEQGIVEIMKHFEDRKVVFLDAPTGAGKTLIGEAVRQLVRQRFRSPQALYVCTTKSLQNQFVHDFTYAKVIKGRSNYPTSDDPDRFEARGVRRLHAGMCTKESIKTDDVPFCDQCEFETPDKRYTTEGGMDKKAEGISHCYSCHPWQSCHYEVAKSTALVSELAIANTAYFLTEANLVGRFGQDIYGHCHFQLAIIDEADTLENVLMGHIELRLPRQAMKAFNLTVPSYKGHSKPDRHREMAETWVEWAKDATEVIKVEFKRLHHKRKDYEVPPPALAADIERVGRYLNQLETVTASLTLEPENWVLDGYDKGDVHFKPIMVTSHARPLLWRHSDRFLLMSATLVSPRQMAQDLGLQDNEWASVVVDSHFPVGRRPIRVQPVVSMSYKKKDTAWPRMAKGIEEILKRHPTDRVLIHTVSYKLTEFLANELRKTEHADRILAYTQAGERDKILEDYRQHFASVLLAPSFDRGIDLPDDQCRVIIIAKVPYPSLGDKQVSQRFYGTPTGRGWFYMETIRSLVQMSGRGMRHHNDQVTTYILDSQFAINVWTSKYGRSRIPAWWKKALIWEGPLDIQ